MYILEIGIYFFEKNEDGESGIGNKNYFKEIKKFEYFDKIGLKLRKICCGEICFSIFLSGFKLFNFIFNIIFFIF